MTDTTGGISRVDVATKAFVVKFLREAVRTGAWIPTEPEKLYSQENDELLQKVVVFLPWQTNDNEDVNKQQEWGRSTTSIGFQVTEINQQVIENDPNNGSWRQDPFDMIEDAASLDTCDTWSRDSSYQTAWNPDALPTELIQEEFMQRIDAGYLYNE
eukprot:TRINITY_DN22926_c0_g1_i1.p1 TRINITY_DN22926_c0_g1~~TRINITY_DN22926_c0_g1_i1.p1  ORF type:complete len:157 (+),score=40.28 TRINITY_DN22926_c0_g1_i1:468-938(+)